LVAAAVLCACLLVGCGAYSGGGAVDIPGLEQELATVIRLEKLGQGTEFDIAVSCSNPQADGLHYSCRVDQASHGTVVNSWIDPVTCRAPGDGVAQRCVSASGYALQ
jgi:hypothetical protein